jgi:hypothetical protein
MPTTIPRRVARQPTRTLTVVAVLALMIVSAAPAGATIVERDRYEFGFSDGYDGCGFDVAVEGAVSGHLHIRAGKGKTDTAFFLRENFSWTETHTNVETGESLTIEGHGLFKDVLAKHVEGNVFEFRAIQAGQPFVVYDSAGNVVLRDRGLVQWTVLFDTGGDDVPGGDVLDVQAELRGQHPGADIDFCDDLIVPLIGH